MIGYQDEAVCSGCWYPLGPRAEPYRNWELHEVDEDLWLPFCDDCAEVCGLWEGK